VKTPNHDNPDPQVYAQEAIDFFISLPGTAQRASRRDRQVAISMHHNGITLEQLKNAMMLAAARRSLPKTPGPPLGLIRSLSYFVPVIEEIRESPLDQDYIAYLRAKLGMAG
jgi:hypothetical protein